jgi:putative ABC transport system permease protein
MTLRDIALLNLRRRKGKALFVLAGLAAGVATMVALVSLTQGLGHEISHKLEKYGANILVTPRSEQLALSYEGLSLGGFAIETRELDQAAVARIRAIKNSANLAAVGPVVLGPVEARGRKALLAGVDFQAARLLKPWWSPRGALPGPEQVLAGSEAARLMGLAPGQAVELGGRRLTVSGVLQPTGSQDDALLFTHLATAQAVLGKEGLISMVEVAALCKDCPVEEMVAQIGRALPGAKVTAIQSVVQGRLETLAQLKHFSLGLAGLVALVGSLVVLVTMMASVKERTGEIGIFRAIGFRRSHVMRVVLLEAALVSLAAGAAGWLAGLAAGRAALGWFSSGGEVSFSLDPALAAAAVAMALVVGVGASVYPALAAARLDPHQALRTL